MLLDLVLAELLTGLEPDHEGTRGLSRVEHDGRATSAGRLDFADVPALHGDACTPLTGLARKHFRRTSGTDTCARGR